MVKLALTVFVAIAIAGTAAADAAPRPTNAPPRPSSYAPRPTTQHVYGSPIEAPIVGRAHAAARRPTATKPEAKGARPVAQGQAPKSRRPGTVPQRGVHAHSA